MIPGQIFCAVYIAPPVWNGAKARLRPEEDRKRFPTRHRLISTLERADLSASLNGNQDFQTFMKRLFALSAVLFSLLPVSAAETPPPVIYNLTATNLTKTFQFTPSPAIQQYNILSGTNLGAPKTPIVSGTLSNFNYRVPSTTPLRFFAVEAVPMNPNDLLAVNLLNRLAYGPTPDELVRVRTMGPTNYINEQLAPENITETHDFYVSQTTNGVPPSGLPEWRFASYTGFFSSSNLYAYLLAAGDAYLDDISLVPLTNYFVTNYTTNINSSITNVTSNVVTLFSASTNIMVNGDFETGSFFPWTVGAGAITSAVTNGFAHLGSYSAHLIASAAGGGAGQLQQNLSNLWFRFDNSSTRGTLSFWYLATPTSGNIKLRLSGSGIVGTGNKEAPAPEWRYATATGTAGGNNAFYLYLSAAGETYIDDLKVVAGGVPEAGPNLIRNGDFETPLGVTNWNATADFTNSFISGTYSHSGAGSLKLVATGGGNGNGDSIFQTNNITISNGLTYTVSFWYLTPTRSSILTARLSGAVVGNAILQAIEPSSTPGSIRFRLDNIWNPSVEDGSVTVSTVGGARLHDLRAYHVLNAVSAKGQLIQVLLQFLENHFVTQHSKSVDYFDRFYDDGNLMDVFSTDWEYRERVKWQAALLNPNCNFYDLLKIHVESPAEIVYLDSVDSRGNGNNIANENYAREIMELFCMGVDNGYDQLDIVAMSRAWTGWSVEIVDAVNINNPHAVRSERVGFYPGNGTSGTSNLIGVWTFNYKPASHGTNRAPIWSNWDTNGSQTNPKPLGSAAYPYASGQSKTVPARFGPPWAGQPYRLVIPSSRSGTNGIADGYDITASIANLPFTMEYLSVKLCRLFVHEGFPNPNTLPGSAESAFYDYTNPNRSAEAELVRQCMVAWDTPVGGRKGNIRSVLNTIFNSDLFRSHGGSLQKVKTPVEFAVSAVRALQSTNPATGRTDGYSISGRSRTASSAPLTRMGSMMLFDRDAPDGFPEGGAPWISSGTLAERVRFIQTFLMTTTDTNKTDTISGGNFNLSDPVALLKSKLAAGSWNNSGAVVDFFLANFFPGEGAGNLNGYRALAMAFLDTNDNGVGSSPFSGLTNTGAPYDLRVRSMVAMLLTLPRFQEQ